MQIDVDFADRSKREGFMLLIARGENRVRKLSMRLA